MNCPKCNAAMEKVTFNQIEIDRCTGCKGLWFDSLELEKLKKMKGSEAIDTGDPKVGKQQNVKDHISCPVCKTPMLRMVDPNMPHLWFESCKVCYGVYLDAGEFKDSKHETLLEFIRDLWPHART